MEHTDPNRPDSEMFTILNPAHSGLRPRLCRLSVPNRQPIETPHYLALTSRGTVPHLSQDNFTRSTTIKGVYAGLEDFIERPDPPIYHWPGPEKLRKFTALPKSSLSVLGARRAVPVQAPAATPNTEKTIAVCTSVGFKNLEAEEFARRSEELQPDVIVALADVPFKRTLGSKRIEKATDRSIRWVGDHVELRKEHQQKHRNGHRTNGTAKPPATKHPAIFAPLLPVSCANQQYYTDALADDIPSFNGLAIYSLDSLSDLPASLESLPRLGFTHPKTPHELLSHISAGLDILTIPFLDTATDAGIAFNFTFPAPDPTTTKTTPEPRPLGTNLWAPEYATSLTRLSINCTCYTCTRHHRAYLQHLLQAKEMLAWVLLAIHNHHAIETFFSGVRDSIAQDKWEEDCECFGLRYESAFSEDGGKGPRVRGYQYRSQGPGEARRNEKVFVPFVSTDGDGDGEARAAGGWDSGGVRSLDGDGTLISDCGEDAGDLEGKGFAKAVG